MKEITSEELNELKNNGKKLVVDYYGSWCGPCRILTPMLEKIKEDYPDITFVKIDVDKSREHVSEMGITSIPTVLFYNGTNMVAKSTGVQKDSAYREVLNKL